MSRMERFYCQTKRSLKMVGRARYMIDPKEPVLPPYLTNSERLFRQPGQPKTPEFKFLSAPFMAKRFSYYHRNVTRLVQNRLIAEKAAMVEDEDGHIWYRGDLNAQKSRRGLGTGKLDFYQDDDKTDFGIVTTDEKADSGIGTTDDKADSEIGTTFSEEQTDSGYLESIEEQEDEEMKEDIQVEAVELIEGGDVAKTEIGRIIQKGQGGFYNRRFFDLIF